MQAGSLFLLDYIPSSYKAIKLINQQTQFLRHQLDIAVARSPATFKLAMAEIQNHDLAKMGAVTSWLDSQGSDELQKKLVTIRQTQAELYDIRQKSGTMNEQIVLVQALIEANHKIAVFLEKDAEVKQSVISLLQLVSMFLVISALVTIAVGARRLLVDRIGALTNFVPIDFLSEHNFVGPDEFSSIERLVYETSARLEGFKAENEWFHQTSSERLRRMIRSQDFLYQFVESVNNTAMTESTLRKGLFLLEKALNINNVALMFTESDLVTPVERILFSHHKPAKLSNQLLDELNTANWVRFVSFGEDFIQSQCLAVGFTSPTGALSILKVEADFEHVFDDSEIQLVELTAALFSMVMGFQGREQESRRLALLEERAAIARELHDSLAQSLSFMKIQISRLQSASLNAISSNELQLIVNELREGLDNAYRELRELLATFRVHMDVRGLSAAIQSAIDEFSQRSNLSINLDNRLVNCRLTVNEEFHILHVIREALSNVVRHASANSVEVALVLTSSGTIMITVDDDGVGYTPKVESDHYGQSIMRERAYSLGGDVVVMRRRQGGTRVRLVFTPKLPQ
jgi:two-component system nitrate/nitrite sensor histidine kinase NarX